MTKIMDELIKVLGRMVSRGFKVSGTFYNVEIDGHQVNLQGRFNPDVIKQLKPDKWEMNMNNNGYVCLTRKNARQKVQLVFT